MTGFLLKAIVAFATLFALCYATEIEIDLIDGDSEFGQMEVFILDVDKEALKNNVDEEEAAAALLEKAFHEEKDNFQKEMIDSLNVQIPEEAAVGRPGKLPANFEMHLNFAAGVYGGSWTAWSCCQKRNNQQTRSKSYKGKKEIVYRSCSSNYCEGAEECKDHHTMCHLFPKDGCQEGHKYYSLMEKLCAKTCVNICNQQQPRPTKPAATTRRPYYTTRKPKTTTRQPWRPTTRKPTTTTRRPWSATTRRPWRPATTKRPQPTQPTRPQTQYGSCHEVRKTTKLYVFTRKERGITLYKYSTSPNPMRPWQKLKASSEDGAIGESFSLYKQKTDKFVLPIYFCKGGSSPAQERWQVKNVPCATSKGWQQIYKLYASPRNLACSKRIFAARSRAWPWATRLSLSHLCCGYTSSIYAFYAPDMDAKSQTQITTSRPTTTRSTTTRRPLVTKWTRTTTRPKWTRPTPKPTTRWTRPTPKPTTRWVRPTTKATTTARPVVHNLNHYNKQCLDLHNLFRAVHGVPALQWSVKLANSAKGWANRLKQIAPENPGKLKIQSGRTRNWPHSDSGSSYRPRGTGENIAWDMSSDGSSAEETVLRWYGEVFFYDRKNPTVSKPNRPVGHLTQLLWRETTHVGCGVAVHDFTIQGRFKTKSTYAVAHYNPAGNVHYRNIQDTNKHFEEMVPNYNSKSCLTKNSCKFENQCMGFGISQTASCECANQGGQRNPVCKADGGCIAWCKRQSRQATYYFWKEECRGKKTCKCIQEPINGVAGAVCE